MMFKKKEKEENKKEIKLEDLNFESLMLVFSVYSGGARTFEPDEIKDKSGKKAVEYLKQEFTKSAAQALSLAMNNKFDDINNKENKKDYIAKEMAERFK